VALCRSPFCHDLCSSLSRRLNSPDEDGLRRLGVTYARYVNRAQNQATVHRTDCPLYVTQLDEKTLLRYWTQTTYSDALTAKTSA